MDQINEDEDPISWIPARLREHQSLTLASDVTLLKCMQKISKRIVTNTNNLLKDLDTLNEDTTSACVEVEYCIQNLNLISTKQFMEKRVYDEDVKDRKEELINQNQSLPTTAVDFVPKIKEAIKSGLSSVKLQIIDFEDGFNGNPPKPLSGNANNGYSLRSLPYLLGTEEFIDSPTVGITEHQKYTTICNPNTQQPDHQSNSAKSSAQSSPSIKSRILRPTFPTPTVDEALSDSEVSSMSEAGVGIKDSVEHKEFEEPQKRQGYNSLQDELAARLRGSSVASSKPSFPPVKTSGSAELCSQEVDSNIPYTPAPVPNDVSVAPREIIQQSKKRNLFDDTSSESENELFKPVAPKTNASLPKMFDQPLPKSTTVLNPPTVVTKVVDSIVPRVKKSNLFGSSDSEDDLFSGIITKEKSTKTDVKPPAKIADANISDKGNHIFSSKDTVNSTQPVASNTVKSTTSDCKTDQKQRPLFDDEDIVDFAPPKPRLFTDPVVKDVSKPNQLQQPELIQPKQRSLFADSDSDEDLFRNVLAKKKEPVLEAPKVSSVSPLPESSAIFSNQFQSTPIQNGDRKADQARKRPVSITDNIPTNKGQDPKPKPKTSLLFVDDSDDEDLFGGASAAKRPISVEKIPALPFLPKPGDNNPSHQAPVVKPREESPVNKPIETLDDPFGTVSIEKYPSSEIPSTTRRSKSPDCDSVPSFDQVTEKPILPIDEIIVRSNDSHADFSVLAVEPLPNAPKVIESYPTTIVDDDDLFGKTKATQLSSKLEKTPVPITFEESDDEDLFKIPKAEPPLVPLPVVSPSKPNESEDEDLVSGRSKKKLILIPTEISKTVDEIVSANDSSIRSCSLESEVKHQASEQSRIASLKLSLAKQPSSLQFVTPGSVVFPPLEANQTLSNVNVRKPFGGVPLFGPTVINPLKSLPPSPVKSQPSSPVKSQPSSPTKVRLVSSDSPNEVNEELGPSSNLLDCVGKQRPKGPSRRLPSRDFRRSKVFNDEITVVETDPPESSKEATDVIEKHDGLTTSEIINKIAAKVEASSLPSEEISVPSQLKPIDRSLFDDSDSSDGELFKVKVPAPLSEPQTSSKTGGQKSNAKINSSLLGSGSDDSVFSSQATIPTPKKIATPSFLLADSDDDDDLFASAPKIRGSQKPERILPVGGNKVVATPTSDPLLSFQE